MTGGYLVLEDGTVFDGQLIGSNIEKAGEVVFLTGGVDGYQEAITDPSAKGKIIVFTYPLVGNYGVTDEFCESDKIHANGIVVREICTETSPYYDGKLLEDYMKEKGAVGMTGVDTRELTLRIRKNGYMKGKIVSAGADVKKVAAELKGMSIDTSVSDVSPKNVKRFDNKKDVTLAVMDLGSGSGLYEVLSERFNVVRFPYTATANEILKADVDGLFVTSGPGKADANDLKDAIKTIKEVAEEKPVMGISLGCELVALAFGAKIEKMKVGHHGCNQPVKINGRICMTSQAQTYALVPDSMEPAGLVVTQTNLNDNVIEGFRHRDLKVFGYEYHPEGGTGQGDTLFLYDDFLKVVKEAKQ